MAYIIGALTGALLTTFLLTRIIIFFVARRTDWVRASYLTFWLGSICLLLTGFFFGVRGFLIFIPCMVFWLFMDLSKTGKNGDEHFCGKFSDTTGNFKEYHAADAEIAQSQDMVEFVEVVESPEDYGQILQKNLKEAESGDAASQFNLGAAYETGLGVPQDYVKAHFWWNLAAASGNQEARKNRDTVAMKMTAEQVAEAQKMATEWTEKHPGK
ncbi:MAG: tetratricopeptide repeat protein [Candidatus Wallbacteria bacterium]|nr:tetratricopeptide repeat protein [Candidatus Wallbacteria bacterium]